MKPLYSSDKTKIIGHLVNGKIIPPAPEGPALDVLVDELAETIEKRFGHFWDKDLQKESDRLDGQLKPHDGTHSRLLLDGVHQWDTQNRFTRGVRSWVTEGTLRSCNELTPVLNTFVAARQLERRMHPERVAKDWKIDAYDLGVIGANFGLPAPPTREELTAEYVERRKQEDERRKRDTVTEAESRARLAEWERESEIESRKKRLLREISGKFFTMTDLNFDGENSPEGYHRARQLRIVFCEVYRRRINQLVDEDKSDEQILEEMTMLNAKTKGVYLSAVPDPLKAEEERHYVETSEEVYTLLADFDRTGKNLTHIMQIMVAMDGRFCITVRPKTEEDYARDAEIDGTVKSTGGVHVA